MARWMLVVVGLVFAALAASVFSTSTALFVVLASVAAISLLLCALGPPVWVVAIVSFVLHW
jgi:hypothetical protein